MKKRTLMIDLDGVLNNYTKYEENFIPEIILKSFSLKPVAHLGFALVFAMAFANRVSPVHDFARGGSVFI